MNQRFLFPDLEKGTKEKPVNVASVPQRSPFRYPGGKTWLVPRFRQWMKSFQSVPQLMIEPFAGGGILSLTAAFENLAEKILMVELDEQVAAVWKTILSKDIRWLIQRILSFELNVDSVREILSQKPMTTRETAFRTLLKNRTAHGGILAEGAGIIKHGENGKGLHSRWYPETIARRIAAIETVSEKIEFVQTDAIEVLEEYQLTEDVVFFIDPPYTAGGKHAGSRLYNHCRIDHAGLYSLCAKLNGDFLMTYDNAEEVRTLAEQHGFKTKAIPMKNTHHTKLNELLVGKKLDWAE
ncbi:MAG: DNA adenine methylase [Planctomycetaceae bacterium]|nr:DNA adenine methylase [Planctomycetaceae bacterium]